MGKLTITLKKGALEQGFKSYQDGGDFDFNLEPGRYNGRVVALRDDGESQLIIDVEVPEANDGKGGKKGQFYSLEPERAQWLFRDLAKLGFSFNGPPTQKELEEVADNLESTKPWVRVRCVHKDGYVNLKIEKLLDESEAPADEPAPEPEKPKAGKVAGKTTAAAKPAAGKGKPAKQEEIAEVAEEVVEEAVEEATPAEEEVEIKKGTKLKAKMRGEWLDGEVTVEPSEGDDKVTVKIKKDGKTYKFPMSCLKLPD